ncbi:MAG: tetratricopeptide repeat protein [Sedimentisphaerales bacterium]|nr:tetratricopeptide repeat protein [Sedimentisphaerales bacterium]
MKRAQVKHSEKDRHKSRSELEINKTSIKYHTLFICLTLVLATFLVFWQVRSFDFVGYDDPEYVSLNKNVKKGLTYDNFIWAFTTGRLSNWHPLTWLSHMLDCQLFGTEPGWHHLVNLVLHILNTLLLFIALKRMTGTLWRSAFVAAVFALHPLHVESVAWVSERKDVLSTFFWFLTIILYVHYYRCGRKFWYLLTVLSFMLGLMAKPMLVTLPFVFLLLDYWPLGRLGRKTKTLFWLILEKISFFLLAAGSSVVTIVAQHGAIAKVGAISLNTRIANALISYAKYITRMFWPRDLALMYPYSAESVLIWQSAIIAALLLLAISVLIVWFTRRRKYLAVGWLWYLGTLVPVIGLVQVGSQAMADRYTYVPLIGLFIIIAWGVPELLEKWRYRKIVLGSSALAVLVILSVCTHIQLRYWRDSLSIFQHTLDVTKNNYIIHNNLGSLFNQQGKTDEAVEQFTEALRIRPDYGMAYNNLGFTLTNQGKLDQAVVQINKALQINPEHAMAHNNLGIALFRQEKFDQAVTHFTKALELNPDLTEIHGNLGLALTGQGRFAEAISQYRIALELLPNNPNLHNLLGTALAQQGKLAQAVMHFNEALRLKPDFAQALSNLQYYTSQGQAKIDATINNLANALEKDPNSAQLHYQLAHAMAEKGNLSKSVFHLRQSLRLEPNSVNALNTLAWILGTNKKGEFHDPNEAIELAERACEVTSNKQPAMLDTLSVCYAALGRFPEAIAAAEKALQLAKLAKQQQLAEDIEAHLELYRAGKPYFEP